jgi:hypothetical protein
LAWAALGCVLVPLVLVWSGVRWSAALEVAGLLLGLVGACAVALRLSSATTPPPPPPPPDGPDADLREVS